MTMRVTVHYMTQLKRSAGRSMDEIDVTTAVVLRDFLRLLADRYDAGFRALLLDANGEPLRSLLFFVGDEHAELTRPLADGDTVTILAPMAGG